MTLLPSLHQVLHHAPFQVNILASIRHPNIVLFMGMCLEPPCLVTEFCARGSLHDVLRKVRWFASCGLVGHHRHASMTPPRRRCTAPLSLLLEGRLLQVACSRVPL